MTRALALAAALTAASAGIAAPPVCPPGLAGKLFPMLMRLSPAGVPAGRQDRIAACHGTPDCVLSAAAWTPAERDLAATRVPGPDAEGVRREIDGIDEILAVYGGAQAPRYPLIDGPDDPPGSPGRRMKVVQAVAAAGGCAPPAAPDPSLGLAAALLAVNDRIEAVAFDPVDARYNAAAAAKARTVDWSRFPYSVILVPGIGPEQPGIALSEGGDANVRMAAERYRRGEAPFVLVTGSNVHPRRTQYAEAIEMGKALVARYGVPASAVIVEPNARHTTTNLRNAARRLLALGIPLDREVLIVTNPSQSAYIEGAEFRARNQRELGYQPATIDRRLSPNDLVVRLSAAGMLVDPSDPLDP